jgi:ribosomal protein S18 acetylase RimI-like enzyme
MTGVSAAATVRTATTADAEACVAIVQDLPDYFTDDVPAKVRDELTRNRAWVVGSGDSQVVGFAIAEPRGAHAAEITWAAVRRDVQNQGHGRALIDHALRELADAGVLVVEVKTLDASANYVPYEATRAFWEHRGFVQIDMIDPLPGWQPGNPSAIYVAALAPTR